MSEAPVREHTRLGMDAMRDELALCRDILIEAQATGTLDRLLPTGASRYLVLLNSNPPPPCDEHDAYVCEQPCCLGGWVWCARCGAVRPSGVEVHA